MTCSVHYLLNWSLNGQTSSTTFKDITSGCILLLQNQQKASKRLKAVYCLLWKIDCKVTERHLPHGITQCYLPPNTDERTRP